MALGQREGGERHKHGFGTKRGRREIETMVWNKKRGRQKHGFETKRGIRDRNKGLGQREGGETETQI